MSGDTESVREDEQRATVAERSESEVGQRERDGVRQKFNVETPHWDAIYGGTDLHSLCFQWRQDAGLALCRRHVQAGGQVLDAGCGTGHAAVMLARDGFRVLGIDISERMVEKARRNARLAGVGASCDFRVCDFGKDWDSLGRFDGILALGFIEYFDRPLRVLETFHALLDPGGVAVVQVWNRRSATALIEEPLLSATRFLRPATLARWLGRSLLPESFIARIRQGRASVPSPPPQVSHRRYTPAELFSLSAAAGLRVAGTAGVRLFSPRSALPEAWKLRLERRFLGLTARHAVARRCASDFLAALVRPEGRV